MEVRKKEGKESYDWRNDPGIVSPSEADDAHKVACPPIDIAERFPLSEAWDIVEFTSLKLPEQERVLPFAPIPGIVAIYGCFLPATSGHDEALI